MIEAMQDNAGKMMIKEAELQFRFTPRLRRFAFLLMAGGLLVILLQLLFPWHPASGPSQGAGSHDGGNPRLFGSLHLALLFALPLALGGIYFSAINHLSGAVWSVGLRRLAEHSVWFLPFVFVLMLLLFLGAGDLFHHWVHAPPEDHLIAAKSAWLNLPSFIGRNIAAFLIWFVLGWLLWKRSIAQDQDGSVKHTHKMIRYSAIFLALFAISYSTNSWDLSMSLEPHWFSTLWAIYIFSGLALTIFAVLALWVHFLKRQGYYGEMVNENHLHDLGKFLWGHTIFWAYIAVSQYMLIWYAALPEETQFFKRRLENGWLYVSMILVLLRFVLPFMLLLKREWKRDFRRMTMVSLLILVGQIWDIYWIVYPTLNEGQFVALSWQELGALALVSGGYIYIIGRVLERHCLIPRQDPHLEESIHFHQ